MTNLIDQHPDEVAALCRRAGARRLDAFGSAVRVDFDPQSSDLDFLVEFDDELPDADAKAYFALKDGLESLYPSLLVIEKRVLTANNVNDPIFD